MSNSRFEIPPDRATVRTVMCPECGALAGDVCQGKRKPRIANHASRVRAWIVQNRLLRSA
jgi:hypothetical protein